MPPPDANDPRPRKIFPLNLTARAADEPRGNPPSTRPESGPDNCFPGLDIDSRNLEKAFFPGLRLEFHLDDGAIVTEVLADGPAAAQGLTNADRPLFLWGVVGRIAHGQALEPVSFAGMPGMECWARVRDLLAGEIAILLGRDPGRTARVPDDAKKALAGALQTREPHLERVDGQVAWVVLIGQRASYLTADGVIDPELFEPGELTRTLCAPWQYDFRDCGCLYWASSKPDLVAAGSQPFSQFMRSNRDSEEVDKSEYVRHRKDGLAYTPLLDGVWNDLPVVIDDRETRRKEFEPAWRPPALMTRARVETELTYLASVEHALAVQYLFAHYSLNAPLTLSDESDETTRRIFGAAATIFSIAVDEMRHLRWVNECLVLLGRDPELGRAEIIGSRLREPFKLERLTQAQLKWFIKVEKPSRSVVNDLDGMYVSLLASVRESDEFSGNVDRRARLIELIKLIIDEGNDHYERFVSVQKHLEGLPEAQYLRALSLDEPKTPFQRDLLANSDAKYKELLDSLKLAFGLNDKTGGTMMEQARRTMRTMHELNHILAGEGLAPPFHLPDGYSTTVPPDGKKPG
jgi:hypothetical protein